ARVTTWDGGSYVTHTFANFWDMLIRGRYTQVRFQDIGNAPIPASLNNADIDQLGGYLTTGQHFRNYQITYSGERIEQHGGILLENVLGSVYLGDRDGLRVIGRFGYEKNIDPGITDLSGPIWSYGILARHGRASLLRVEYGQRYQRPTWSGSASLLFTPS